MSRVDQAQTSFSARLARLFGLDKHVLSTLMFRGWALSAGIFTMLLVPLCLPKEHQGFYFTFSSLISIQIFFELGFNHVISQIVSHDVSLLQQSTDPVQQQKLEARLVAVRGLAKRWYRVMAALFAPTVFFLGIFFFHSQRALPMAEWIGPWGLLCAASSLNLYVSPQLAIAEGLGRIDRVARLRLLQSIAGYSVMWALLVIHAKLWSAVAVPLLAMLMSFWWVRFRAFCDAPQALREIRPEATDSAALTWRRDVLPLQWRIALSWVSGYFIFQIFNPFIFAHHGAVAAGRTGLALAAYTAIQGLGMSWVNATSPMLSAAIARGNRAELKATFRQVAWRSLAFAGSAATVLVIVTAVASLQSIPLSDRIADVPTLIFMGIATLANCAIASMAIFMRCHKEEPMLANSLVTAILTVIAVAIGSALGVQLAFALYAAVTVLVSLPWTLYTFRTYWQR